MGNVRHEAEPQGGLFTAKIVAPSADVPIYLNLATRVDALMLGPEMNISIEDDGKRSTMLVEGASAPLDVLKQALNVRQESIVNQHMADLALAAEMDTFFARLNLRFPGSQPAA